MSQLNLRLYIAWMAALIATGSSLYFSEIAGFIPCELCWWQRIFMYPLVIFLGFALYRNDRPAALYTLPLPLIGGIISIVHLLEQHAGLFAGICKAGVPCSGKYIEWLGFITIPLLALVAFIIIAVCLIMEWRQLKNK